MAPRRNKGTKNPPIFSHEFLIQNHADIVSCVAMVFVIGLMFQATNPVATLFVAMQHNVSMNDSAGEEMIRYTWGKKDVFSVFFYFLICVVVHAVIQEYILDKMNRKMHLSKVKHSKFNESGQLLVFYLSSVVWGADIILREGYVTGISQLWEGYPQDHAILPFIVKFFFIIQIAYWLHCFPELYFQKVKKEEVQARIQYICLYLYLFFIVAAYVLNFTRVALCMLVIHYAVEFVFHVARLCYFSERADLASNAFMSFNILFVLVRLGTITLAVLTFWYGLEQTNQPSVDVAAGNFNTWLVRINCLFAICLMQAWLMWNFITFQLRKLRERSSATRKTRSPSKKKPTKASDDDLNSLPEVDQNSATENGSLRTRSKVKKSL
ncbi:LOW QUALITY PROTEIN: translocating chain-associated membrane protein 1-like 1 [Littorina saxatilis]|uniref:LOW QUALITY PROTEIN: translocating chain-associated membrane protein 1-like 1 n=1 Tax=Littorina saxatilis TaxID=31220 RepID=UPI0038B48F13